MKRGGGANGGEVDGERHHEEGDEAHAPPHILRHRLRLHPVHPQLWCVVLWQ